MNKRKEKRDKAALHVCQEVRHQLVNGGGITDINRLVELYLKWHNLTGKEKFDRLL